LAAFYPPYLREVFTNRAHELAALTRAADELEQGRPQNVAIFGLRRIGKSLLCHEQVDRLLNSGEVSPVYMDIEGISSSPESFAQRYIGLTCYWLFGKAEGPIDSYLSANRLLETKAAENSTVVRAVGSLAQELDRRQPDYSVLLKLAFDFPEQISQDLNQSIMLFLDEFTELSELSNFPGVGDPLKQFRSSMQQQSSTAYVIAGSAITAMEKLVHDHESPLFLQFQPLELRPFTEEDTGLLVERLFGRLAPPAQSALYTYTFGHPFYVTSLTERIKQMTPSAESVTKDKVNQAFLLETLSPQGKIYNYCRYLYDVSLQKARGYGLLKAVLQILAEEESLTTSEIARRIRRQPPATQGYLRWLIDVDLVVKKEKKYFFRDPVLRFWIAQSTQGIEVDPFPKEEKLADLVGDLSERFQRVSSQLGVAKESEVRELLRQLGGETVGGSLMDQTYDVKIPAFAQVTSYVSSDGQIEFDALGEIAKEKDREDYDNWIVEVKWRQKRVGRKDLESLTERAKPFRARVWCVSRAGFTQEALDFARDHGVLTSTGEDLKQLQKIVE